MRIERIPAAARGLALTTLACGLTLLPGCGPSKTEPGASASGPAPARSAAPVLSEEQAAALEPFAKPQTEADRAWQEVLQATRAPAPPQEWLVRQPTEEELAAFENQNAQLAAAAAAKAQDFYTRFAQHENADEARRREHHLLSIAVQLGHTNGLARLEELEQARLKDPTLSEDDRWEIRFQQLERSVRSRRGEGQAAALTTFEQGVRELQKEFTNRVEVAELLLSAAQGWLDAGEAGKSLALARELAQPQAEAEIREAAAELIQKAGRVGQPLQIQFTAFDGRAIDLQKMPGKVILVDFWATWCRPCLAELPKLKAAYEKYRPRGFEIVGISFDDDKAALERVLTREKLPWPQYFDAEDAGKKYGEEFGISGIPTLWLVDKQGRLRELNAREDLEGKIQKLLAE